MRKSFLYYFIPSFLIFYFVVAYYPFLKKEQGEIFPFFSFRLYSTVDNNFETYDLLINQGMEDETFLLFRNSSLNELERKYCKSLTQKVARAVKLDKFVDISEYDHIIGKTSSVAVVKISGGYIQAERDGKFEVEVVKQIR
ncbi:MAG: hypothetical protein ACJAZ2_001525 [Glaciecola sp.]|jgi:hypothetical protein